jgi:hypothetical protein
MSTSTTNVKRSQIKHLLCQQGPQFTGGRSDIFAFPPGMETLGLNVKLACLERNKTILHSMLRLRNGPRLPPSFLLDGHIHPCMIFFHSIMRRQTKANAQVCQTKQTVHSSGIVHSR